MLMMNLLVSPSCRILAVDDIDDDDVDDCNSDDDVDDCNSDDDVDDDLTPLMMIMMMMMLIVILIDVDDDLTPLPRLRDLHLE